MMMGCQGRRVGHQDLPCLVKLLLCVVLVVPSGAKLCSSRSITVRTSISFEYQTPGYPIASWGSYGYEKKLHCKVIFQNMYDVDGVQITVFDTDMPARNYQGDCSDKATFYDGRSTTDPVLAVVCGSETPQIKSSGNAILMVFETDDRSEREYKGVKLSYKGLDRGGSDTEITTPVGVVVVAVAVVIVIFVVACICRRRQQRMGVVLAQSQRQQAAPTQNVNVAMTNLQITTNQEQQPQQPRPPPQSYAPPPQGYHHPQQPMQQPYPGHPPPQASYPAPLATPPAQPYPPPPGHQPYPAAASYQPYPQPYPPPQQPHAPPLARGQFGQPAHPYPPYPPPQSEVSQPLLSGGGEGARGMEPSAPPSYDETVMGTCEKPPLN